MMLYFHYRLYYYYYLIYFLTFIAARDKACEGTNAKSTKLEQAIKRSKEATDDIDVEVQTASTNIDNMMKQRQFDENQLHTAKADLTTAEANLDLARRAIPKAEERMGEVKSLLRVTTDEELKLQEKIRESTTDRNG